MLAKTEQNRIDLQNEMQEIRENLKDYQEHKAYYIKTYGETEYANDIASMAASLRVAAKELMAIS